jgi:hypothetical protein
MRALFSYPVRPVSNLHVYTNIPTLECKPKKHPIHTNALLEKPNPLKTQKHNQLVLSMQLSSSQPGS